MQIEKAPGVAPYFAVRLNFPWRHADTIRALVPDGQPVSTALMAILLEVAEQRGAVVQRGEVKPDDIPRLETAIAALAERVDALHSRLDATLSTLRRS